MKDGIILFGLVSVWLCPVISVSKALKLHHHGGHSAPDPPLLPCWTDELYPSGINNESQTYIIPMTLDSFSQTVSHPKLEHVLIEKAKNSYWLQVFHVFLPKTANNDLHRSSLYTLWHFSTKSVVTWMLPLVVTSQLRRHVLLWLKQVISVSSLS